MHPTTFGDFPAAATLAALLHERQDERLSAKVSSVVQDFNVGLAQLEALGDAQYRTRFALLWREDFLGRIAFEPEIAKFLRNVLTGCRTQFASGGLRVTVEARRLFGAAVPELGHGFGLA